MAGRIAIAAAVVLAAWLGASGCTWYTWVPKDPPKPDEATAETLTPIAFDESYKAELDCQHGRCNARFRLDVMEPGQLQVDVRPDLGDETGFRVTLEDTAKRVLDQHRAVDDEPFQLATPVAPGRYFVLVQTLGKRVTFEVRASFATAR